MTTESIQNQMNELGLFFGAEQLETFLHEETKCERPLMESLFGLFESEINRRRERSARTRLKISRIPQIKTVEDFDVEAVEGISRRQLNELSGMAFMERRENIVFMGPSGLGKTHLLLALARKACLEGYTAYYITCMELIEQLKKAKLHDRLQKKIKNLCKPHLLAVDEIGYQKLDIDESALFFQLVAARYEKNPMIITTNKAFGQWTELMAEPAIATATLDRLLHHANVFILKGESYRLKKRIENGLVPRRND